jgi:hypothetical protein
LGCAFHFRPSVRLLVLECSSCVSIGAGGCQVTGVSNPPSGVLTSGVPYTFWPADDPGHTCNNFPQSPAITVQQHLPAGRTYNFAGLR